jgi:hypothetical protein
MELEESRRQTDQWIFKGGTGTYLRAVTLPRCIENAQRERRPLRVQIEVINPTDEEVCTAYTRFRRSLSTKPDGTGETWTLDRTRKESFATILAACWYLQRFTFLSIDVGLSANMSTFRWDLSSRCVIMTTEDPASPSLMFEKPSPHYRSYSRELASSFSQTHRVALDRAIQLSDEPTMEETRGLFEALGLNLPHPVLVMYVSAKLMDEAAQLTLTKRALRVLEGIAAGENEMTAVRHPLGFVCFPIVRQGDNGVCVHVWSPQLFVPVRSTMSPMHSHSWDLVSVVLFGELRNDLVAVLDGEPTHRVFEIHNRGDVDEVRGTSRLVGCRTETTELNHAGETYEVRVGQFHATFAREAATVAVGKGQPGAIDLSLGRIDDHTHFVRRERCNRSDTVSAARMVVRHVCGRAS